MPTYTTNYNLIVPGPLDPRDANIWGPMINSNTSFSDTYFLSLANNFIGATQPTIPDTGTPARGQFWIDNTTATAMPLQIYDGTNWVTIGTLNTVAHTFTTIPIVVAQRFFIASTTYVPTPNTSFVQIQAIGAGGAGGGANGGSYYGAGGGGGAGGVGVRIVPIATIGTSQVLTIGAGGVGASGADGGNGGDTSLGTIIIAKGGHGGKLGDNFAGTSVGGLGGAGGVAGSGAVNGTGAPGGAGISYAAAGLCGIGGSTIYGGSLPATTANGNGGAGTGFGSGGNGGVAQLGAGPYSGGDGAPGLIIITEYR